MHTGSQPTRAVVKSDELPLNYPTHLHNAEFWEALGRTVATFGFLEETLGKAIFAFTATRQIPDDQIESEFQRWLPTLKRALSDPLGGLITSYGNAVRANSKATIENLDDLLDDLRKAAEIRNALCHGSWRIPDDKGRSIPLYVDRKDRIFQTPVDIAFLEKVQRHAAKLAGVVVSTVSHMGYRFPGTNGPGIPLI